MERGRKVKERRCGSSLLSDSGSVFLTFRQDLPAVFIALYSLPRRRLGAVQLLEQRLAVVDVGGSEFFLAGDAVGGGGEGEGGGVAEEGEKEEEGEGEVHWVLWEGGLGALATRAMAKMTSLFESESCESESYHQMTVTEKKRKEKRKDLARRR